LPQIVKVISAGSGASSVSVSPDSTGASSGSLESAQAETVRVSSAAPAASATMRRGRRVCRRFMTVLSVVCTVDRAQSGDGRDLFFRTSTATRHRGDAGELNRTRLRDGLEVALQRVRGDP